MKVAPTGWVIWVITVGLIALVTVVSFILAIIYQATSIDSPPIVSQEWVIAAVDDEIVWGEGEGIDLVGTFECADDLAVGAPIQFSRSVAIFADEDGDRRRGIISVDTGPAVEAGRVCSSEPDREFSVRWSNLNEVGEPSSFPFWVSVVYSASSPGRESATAQTDLIRVTGSSG